MPNKRLLVLVASLALLAVPVLSQAQAHGGGGGGGSQPPAGDLYGDLYVIERDGNGEPILRGVTYLDGETGLPVTVDCQQPLADTCGLLPLWGECGLAPLPAGVLPLPTCTFDPELYDPCAVYSGPIGEDLDGYADQVQEVSFGRASVARSQPFVIDSAYAEALKTFNIATAVAYDPAGRIQLYIPTEEDPAVSFWKTIDAPLENLGLYRELMKNGCLGTVTDEVVGEGGVAVTVTYALEPSAIALLQASSPDLLCDYADTTVENWWLSPIVPDTEGVAAADMLMASSFIAGATDKSDPLSLDEIINVNTYLTINSYTYEKVKKEWNLIVTYFSFRDPLAGYGSESWFGYTRSTRFASTTAADLLVYELGDSPVFLAQQGLPLFSEPPLLQEKYPYSRVDLDEVDLTVCRGGFPDAEVCDDAANDVPYSDADRHGCGGANWFAQAAEHARKTVWYLHNWELPALDN